MLRFGFFDSEITGYDEEGMPQFDRAESSDFYSLFYANLISDGVLGKPSNCFQVMAYTGMQLKVSPGVGFIRGRFAYDEFETYMQLEPAPKSYKRVDRIIMRVNYRNRCCEIIKKTGVSDANPVAPVLERPAAGSAGDFYELSLATVLVKSNQTVISQADITDTRLDNRQCGIVHSVIEHVSTETLFNQYVVWYKEFIDKSESDWINWFNAFKNTSGTQFKNWYDTNTVKWNQDVYKRMDEIVDELSKMTQENGPWQANKVYRRYNIVTYDLTNEKRSFIALNEVPAGTLPTNANYWAPITLKGDSGIGLTPRGQWEHSISYGKDDLVVFKNTLWGAKRNSAGKEPNKSSQDWFYVLGLTNEANEIRDETQNVNYELTMVDGVAYMKEVINFSTTLSAIVDEVTGLIYKATSIGGNLYLREVG